MAFEIVELVQRVLTLNVTGHVSSVEVEQMRAATVNAIERWRKIRMFVISEASCTYETCPLWRDRGFIAKYQKTIERIAILGDDNYDERTHLDEFHDDQWVPIKAFSLSARDQAVAWILDGL